jgi:hypothetical protein
MAQQEANPRGTEGNRGTENLPSNAVGNPGTLLGMETVKGTPMARFRAEPGTWVSASMKSLGYDRIYGRDEAYGAYRGVAKSPSGQPLSKPDRLTPGQEYLIPVPGVAARTEPSQSDPKTDYARSGGGRPGVDRPEAGSAQVAGAAGVGALLAGAALKLNLAVDPALNLLVRQRGLTWREPAPEPPPPSPKETRSAKVGPEVPFRETARRALQNELITYEDPDRYRSFEEFRAAAPLPYSTEYLQSVWDTAHPAGSANDIVATIAEIEKPRDVVEFWERHVAPNHTAWSQPLSELERQYIAAFRYPTTPAALHMRIPVDPAHLTSEEREASERLFGSGQGAVQQYANYENRRRIMAHYFYTHPATLNLQLGIYRFVRDINPLHFALERGWQIGGGQEMFTSQDVSRLGAAGEFLASLALVYGIGKAVRAARPTPGFGPPTRPKGAGALTDPIWELPPEGGGKWINGRWYTEHALERMAPDTPQIRAELVQRLAARLQRIGIGPNHPAYGPAMARGVSRIDPRGVSPSVVEAEIANPGSTSACVITARGGGVVVTVIPR